MDDQSLWCYAAVVGLNLALRWHHRRVYWYLDCIQVGGSKKGCVYWRGKKTEPDGSKNDRHFPLTTLAIVARRDKGICQLSGERITEKERADAGHRMPDNWGGVETPNNTELQIYRYNREISDAILMRGAWYAHKHNHRIWFKDWDEVAKYYFPNCGDIHEWRKEKKRRVKQATERCYLYGLAV